MRCGMRQSMPSKSIETCAGVTWTFPSAGDTTVPTWFGITRSGSRKNEQINNVIARPTPAAIFAPSTANTTVIMAAENINGYPVLAMGNDPCRVGSDKEFDFRENFINYKQYLISTLPGADLKNIGKLYHIDHIKPLCTFNLLNKEEQFEAFNYKNTRLLFIDDNLSRPKDGSDIYEK